MAVIEPRGRFTTFGSKFTEKGILTSGCSCGCGLNDRIEIKDGDIIKSNLPQGMMLMLADGTLVRAKEITVYKIR